MTPTDPLPTDADLLAAYRDRRSADAFAALVGRHAGWVHAAARRRVGGDEHLAHDVAQAVFVLLAERADSLRDGSRLGGWLLRTTAFAARDAVRGERRRRRRERLAARPERLVPDDAVARLAAVEAAVDRLAESDRSLVVARFHRGLSLAEVGAERGLSADAARKRLDRVLGRLRGRLAESPAPLLAGLLAMNHTTSSTVSLAVPSRSAASPRVARIVRGVSNMHRWNRIKVASALSLVLAASAGGVVWACVGGSPTTEPTSAPAAPKEVARWMATQVCEVIVAQDGRTLTGYSLSTGVWSQVKAAVDGGPAAFSLDRCVMAGDVAVYRGPADVWAFSPTQGTWAKAGLPAGTTDAAIEAGTMVSSHVATVRVPGFVYAYSPETGHWQGLAVGRDGGADWSADTTSVRAMDDHGRIHLFAARTGKWSDGF